MEYRLAKQLKEAGFPQKGDKDYSVFWVPPSGTLFLDSHEKAPDDAVYLPNLSELINLCGEDIESLTQEHSQAGNEWVASSWNAVGGHIKFGRGSTPEIAVAKLWLSLNKKV